MRIKRVELIEAGLPLVRPFQTSFTRQYDREFLLLKVETDGAIGWGECVAMSQPLYSSEYLVGAKNVIEEFLLPALKDRDFEVEEIPELFKKFLGHPMAKASVEAALLDASLKTKGISFAEYFGASRSKVPCGVSVGISPTIDQLMEEVESYVDAGYKRIKLKIQPGWDIEPVAEFRKRYPNALLQVDANQAYTRDDIDHLTRLDEFDLLLNEQPLAESDLIGHAALAAKSKTPVCLDESIISLASAKDAIEMKATSVINVKPGRVGGYLEAKKIHDWAQSISLPLWCGGMLESGIGRAANVALAALAGFTLPGDTSASDRYYHRDITEPFIMENGELKVPTKPGIGVDIDEDYLNSITYRRSEQLL
jgi:O-succinylbenzoate synthase